MKLPSVESVLFKVRKTISAQMPANLLSAIAVAAICPLAGCEPNTSKSSSAKKDTMQPRKISSAKPQSPGSQRKLPKLGIFVIDGRFPEYSGCQPLSRDELSLIKEKLPYYVKTEKWFRGPMITYEDKPWQVLLGTVNKSVIYIRAVHFPDSKRKSENYFPSLLSKLAFEYGAPHTDDNGVAYWHLADGQLTIYRMASFPYEIAITIISKRVDTMGKIYHHNLSDRSFKAELTALQSLAWH